MILTDLQLRNIIREEFQVLFEGSGKDSKSTIQINKDEMEQLHRDKELDKDEYRIVYDENGYK
jgi:hypothetical protein|tara:strand:+ start:317 stop:505 length:189 start_codon:yes stop_codon:yes gene_type:complete